MGEEFTVKMIGKDGEEIEMSEVEFYETSLNIVIKRMGLDGTPVNRAKILMRMVKQANADEVD